MAQESDITPTPSSTIVGRLAPSPTGALHLGNARTFLLAWLSVRQQSGEIYLRIEDLDSPRVKPWAVGQTIEDLRWLGLDWDHLDWDHLDGDHLDGDPVHPGGQDPGFDAWASSSRDSKLWLQTARIERYLEILHRLIDEKQAYPCFCSRSDVAAAASAPHNDRPHRDLSHRDRLPELDGQIYPGTCRDKPWQPDQLTEKHSWRWRFSDGVMTFVDALHGPVEVKPAHQLGDFVIAKSEEERITPAYQLAVVIDDHDQGVTEVVRGDDLLYSTFRQLAIWNFLGWQAPRYIHVPLIVGPDGRRLAKRHGDTRLSHFRELGIRPQAIVGYLAFSLGIAEEPMPLSPQDLLGKLRWESLPREATVFDLSRDQPLLQRLS